MNRYIYISNISNIFNMVKPKQETTTLLVTREVRDFIDDKGERNETFDEILRRLLNIK